ncbi:MAG: PH domain-containing protein [Oscillospiraceae bacterium]
MKCYRAHPIMILENLWRFLFLLILPLVRGFFAALQGGLGDWLAGAWFDILVLLVMVGLSVIQWLRFQIRFTDRLLQVDWGIFYRKRSRIQLDQVCTVSVVRPFFLKPFGAVHMTVDTLAGNSDTVDLRLTISRKLSEQVIRGQNLREYDRSEVRSYRPGTVNVAVLSIMMSNSLAGILFLVALISQLGNLLGEAFSNRIVGTFQRFAQMMAFGIPPAAAALAYILLFGWLYSVLLNMVRYQRFTVGRTHKALLISGGVITNRDYCIALDSINFVDIRQTLMSRLFGIYSVFVNAVGFGKQKDDLSAVLPATTRQGMRRCMAYLLPEYREKQRQLKPNAGAIFKFIIEPIWACVLIPAAATAVYLLFERWRDVTVFIGVMLMLPAVWFLAIRLWDFFTSGVAFDGEYYTLRYSRGMFLHTVIIPKSKMAYVDVRQSIIQKTDQKCDVKFRTIFESRNIHHIRNIDRQEAIDICGLDVDAGDETKTPIRPAVK